MFIKKLNINPLKHLSHYLIEQSGTILISFAIVVPILIMSLGLSLDYARAYLVQQRLQQAIDASALAAAASSDDPDIIEQKVLDFFEANYPPEKLGITIDPVVQVDGDSITVTANALYNTLFMRIIGIDDIDVNVDTTVQREVKGVEVVLVMDNTGSMATNNNISALRTAATNFVDIMFDRISDEDQIRIGLVPYSTSVNVGPYGLGEDLDGYSYDTPFVDNPHNLDYDTGDSDEWHGCVLAEDYSLDTEDHEGPWDMYRYCLDENENVVCDYNTQKVCTGKGKKKTCSNQRVARHPPNYICPETHVLPLTNDYDQLIDTIDSMQADGHTYGNFGMVWGYRLISPEYPFTEGASWDSNYWQKAIIMMTDGVNTMHPYYSAYGPTSDHNISANDLNERFAEVCENLKDKGVTIYTVTFSGGVDDETKEYYKECATSLSHYRDAPDQDNLINVFESISRELSNLHITQ
ncbi:MAG: hypothetical protein H6857_00335 [Rhodospirillales bacterium]|nr:hypothetical protein [Rhodospirillales bacterium]